MPRAAGITTTVVPTVAMLETAASFATFETIGGLNF